MNPVSRRRVVVSVVMLLAMLILALGVQASQGTQLPGGAQLIGQPVVVGGGVVKEAPAEEQAVEYSLWTREAMAAAQPYALAVPADEVALPAAAPGVVEIGPAIAAVAPGLPESGSVEAARLAYPEDWAALEEAAADLALDAALSPDSAEGTSAVFTRYELNRFIEFWTGTPFRRIGRLNFLPWDGGAAYCTASVVSTKNIIATAAHCLYDTQANKWHKNWSFVPAYRNGAAPFGTFPYSICAILPAYIGLPFYSVVNGARFDVGLCKMRPNSAGANLSAAVGNFGQRYPGVPEHIHDIGYPSTFRNGAAVPNAGRYTWVCAAETRLYTTDTLAWGCDLASGMSGAPVIYRYAPFVATGWVESVHSGGFAAPNDAHGPRFKATNIGTLCTTLGGC